MNPRVLELRNEIKAIDLAVGEMCAKRYVLNAELEILESEEKKPAHTKKTVPLTFGKNIITWDGGALPIKGKGYKFIKALYEAKNMRLKEAALDRLVWDGELSSHKTFRELIRWLSEKLEKVKFPYHLKPAMSKGKVKAFLNPDASDGRPLQKWIEPVVMGAKLGAR